MRKYIFTFVKEIYAHMKEMEICIDTRGNVLELPQFIMTTTLFTHKREPVWKTPEEVLQFTLEKGMPIRSKTTLLNYEKRGMLTAKRISARKIYYDLNEIELLFSSASL